MSSTSHRTAKGRQLHMVPLEKMVEESIAFIRKHAPPEGYFVGFSGGKDSIVTLELVRRSGVKHEAYYNCTGIDPPEVVKFIKQHYPYVKWLYPKYSFLGGIKIEGMPPTRIARWCCDVLKKDPSKNIPLSHRLVGIRAEESHIRKSRGKMSKVGKQLILKPIFDWKEWHIWDFIDQNSLPYPSLYDEGFGRIGCIICPFLTPRQHQQHRERWPKFYELFEKKVREWFDSGRPFRQPMIKRIGIINADDYLRWWIDRQNPKCTCPMNDCAGVGK